jgi:hypothetical protein
MRRPRGRAARGWWEDRAQGQHRPRTRGLNVLFLSLTYKRPVTNARTFGVDAYSWSVRAPDPECLLHRSQILSNLAALDELTGEMVFIGAVEPENEAARRCMRSALFEVAEREDEEGMLRISRTMCPNSS